MLQTTIKKNEPEKHLKAQMKNENIQNLKSENTKAQAPLTSDDVNNIIQQDEVLNMRPLPYIEIFGLKVNLDSLIISLAGLLIWIFIWKFFNLFETGLYSFIFFFMYILLLIFNIYNSSLNTETNMEMSTYEIEKQLTNVEAAMGVIIILFVFLYNIQMDSNARIFAYKLLTIDMIMCSFAIIKYALKNDTRNIRMIRIANEKIYNQAIILFIFSLVVIYLGIVKK